MLKISIISDSDQAIQFQLEGKLIGPWVEELQRLKNASQVLSAIFESSVMLGTQLAPLDPECLVPIRGSGGASLQGFESSSGSGSCRDHSEGSNVMRSITLAEKMAEQMEAERRAEQEMQIAR